MKKMTWNDMKDSVHAKAIRLIEGGIVNIDGLSVKLVADLDTWNPCEICEMDSLCHFGDEMCAVCIECDSIIKSNCLLKLSL